MKREPYDIPDIMQSLRQDVDAGRLTIEQAAEELCATNWTPYIDIDRTRHLLYGDETTMKIYYVDPRKMIPIGEAGYLPGQEQAKVYLDFLPKVIMKDICIEPDAAMIPQLLRLCGIDHYAGQLQISVRIEQPACPYMTVYYLRHDNIADSKTISWASNDPKDYDLANKILALLGVFKKESK